MKNLISIFLILLFTNNVYAQVQTPQHAAFRLSIPSFSGLPTHIDTANGELILHFSDTQLEALFASYQVFKFEKEFPTSTTPLLQTIYYVETNNIQLKTDLLNGSASYYPIIEEIPQLVLTHTPNDFGTTGGAGLRDFAKELMNMELAWDLTTGDPNIIIGIIDEDFDLNHEDLTTQILSMTGNNHLSGSGHGTLVAGAAGAATNNNIGITGTGYNCKLALIPSVGFGSFGNKLLLLAQNGSKVINISLVSGCTFSPTIQLVIDEIFNMGTVILAGAGNGPKTAIHYPQQCGPNSLYYPASYNHVISVSSVSHINTTGIINVKDVHEEVIGDPNTAHTHNSAVDIVAPGHNVLSTKKGDLYAGAWGTSFATPFVSGIAGLILSINPCLNPDEVEAILKSTAVNIDAIPANVQYAGLLGSGRVDAFQAVQAASLMAQNSNIQLAMSSTGSNFICNSNTDGTATANIFLSCGGTPPLSYSWDDPNTQTTQTATGLLPGTYTVTVNDAAGLSASGSVTVDNTSSSLSPINPVITGNVTWSGIVSVTGEVIIERGGVLTINCAQVFFSSYPITELGIDYFRARFTVKEGGTLIIDNSEIGNLGFDGIEIWGDPNLPQTTGATGAQGLVIIKNNSIIKDANLAIQCERTPLQNIKILPSFGGIIQASNSSFINNNQGIFMRDYPGNSNSFFLNCTFTYDDNSQFSYGFSGVLPEMNFVQLNGMSGVLFLGSNLFQSLISQPMLDQRGTAISSFDSEYRVLGGTFKDLYRGVDASASNSIMGIEIRSCSFNNCGRGVFIKGIDFSKIESNTFTVLSSTQPQSYGLYMQETTGYSIRKNVFNGSTSSIGLYIDNNGKFDIGNTNTFNLNTFNGLEFASFANGRNGFQFDATVGLKVKCNTYNNTTFSLLTTKAPGISIQQGSSFSNSSPAGNAFNGGCTTPDGQLFNSAATGLQPHSYDYFHHSDPPQYVPDVGCFTGGAVFSINTNQSFTPASCTTFIGGGGTGTNTGTPGSLRQIQLDNTTAVSNLKMLLNDGNSNNILITVQQETLMDKNIKKLLKKSEPLSTEVLIAMANSSYKDKTIKKVLVKNSLLNDKVIVTLLGRSDPLKSKKLKKILKKNLPLHQEMIALLTTNVLSANDLNTILIKQAQKIANNTPRIPSETQEIEANINAYLAENKLIDNELIRLELHDFSKSDRFTKIITVLDNQNTNLAATKSIQAACRDKDFSLAIQKIEALELNGTALEFCNLQRALITMDGLDDKLMSVQTDPNLEVTVLAAALDKTLPGSINAQNLLETAFAIPVIEQFDYPILFGNSSRIFNEEDDAVIQEQFSLPYQLTNYPNPFNENTTVKAFIPTTENNAYLVIRNIVGTEVYRKKLVEGRNLLNIKGNRLTVGMYFYSIESNKTIFITEKMIKAK